MSFSENKQFKSDDQSMCAEENSLTTHTHSSMDNGSANVDLDVELCKQISSGSNMSFYNISFLTEEKEGGAEDILTDRQDLDNKTGMDIISSVENAEEKNKVNSDENSQTLLDQKVALSSQENCQTTLKIEVAKEDEMPTSKTNDKLCGWLNKFGHRAIVKTYKARWFVYGDNTCKLYYYRTPQDLLPLGEIDIHNASFTFNVHQSDRPGLFEISSEGREYYLDARNRPTMMYWLQELQHKRREFSKKLTNVSKTRVTLLSTNQKSIDEGLLARQKNLHNDKDCGEQDKATDEHTSHLKPPDILIGQNTAGLPPSGLSITNFSLTNFRTEIRNYVSALRSPAFSPSTDFYNVNDKSPSEDWTVVSPDSCQTPSPKPSPPGRNNNNNNGSHRSENFTSENNSQATSNVHVKPAAFNTKFSFSNFRKILRKGNEEIEISSPSTSVTEPCQKCRQLKNYLTLVKEELTSVEEELQATREVTKLLQREIDKLRSQINSGNELSKLSESSPAVLIKQRDDKIVDLEYLLAKTQEEKQMVKLQLRDQDNLISTQNDQVSMLQEMLTAKDDVIKNLTNQVYDLEQGQGSNTNQSNVTAAPPVLRVFTDATEVENLKDSCEAYKIQNKFLSKEILELNELRKNDENREGLLQIQYAHLEARFYQTRSKYLFLLNELKTPVREFQGEFKREFFSEETTASVDKPSHWTGLLEKLKSADILKPSLKKHDQHEGIDGGEEGKSQDFIDQLLEDALNPSEEEKMAELLSSQNSTMEYDRYGFLKSYDLDDEPLVTMATELQQRSNELELQIKEVDQSGVISHQVKWENFMVSLGEKPLQTSQELKELVRGGIPHQYREPIWKGCVNLRLQSRSREENYYQNLVELSEKNRHNPAAKQIELDLLRTLPTNKYYETIDSDGVVKLRRVLLAYSWHNPDIGYCQGLNRLAAIALLFLNEEEAFWCLVAIIEAIMPPEYYNRTLMAAQADQRVLKDLLGEKLPRLHAHLETHKVDLTLFTFNWFLTIFIDNIPPDTFLRIWDVFLYEGDKVLFRYALAFLKYREEEILQQSTAININKYLRVIGDKMTDVRRLTQIAFHELNPFPRRVITSRRHYHMIQVKAELKELDALREDFLSHSVPSERLDYYSDEDLDSDRERQVSPSPPKQ